MFQRRVSFRTYKYFFHPIYETPFSLGIALPADYGMYEIVAEEEVKLSSANGKPPLPPSATLYVSIVARRIRFSFTPPFFFFTPLLLLTVSEFFRGKNWTVHPDW